MLSTGELEELGRRASECRHFVWMRGMISLPEHGWRASLVAIDESDNEPVWSIWHVDGNRKWDPVKYGNSIPATYPDLSDAATLGCMLQLVRLAWQGKFVVCEEGQITPDGLVSALEAAQSHVSNPRRC